MNEVRTCEQCGAVLDANAPEGLCPRCVLTTVGNLRPDDSVSEDDSAQAGDSPEKTPASPAINALTDLTGTTIGRYKLLQQIGEGGFGVVYMAEQQEPVQRKVAIKVIKAGMDTREVIARFEAERQALALMDHPNIAQVLDGGATSSGRPYFVMELVRGLPITAYCDQGNLSTRERLELFIKVCRAVQHAHQKGVIHRDLKPSNVLVTLHDGEPVPKVIDFGVAKALGQKLTDKTLFTRFEQMIGTPAYMSPEQAALSGLDIDTRSDIYSLGVLLYELLTGVTPFDPETFRQAALDEVRRMIQETEPPKPSTRLLTLGERLAKVAKHRHAEPVTLTRLIRGDLDWITMKALEKDRRRRYETVNGLTADLERHLHDEPVLARPPSAFYRFERAVRRHRAAFAAGAAVAIALLVGVVISTWQAVRAKRAERQQSVLRQQAQTAQANEATQRQRAEKGESAARQKAYASDMNLAQEALKLSNLGRARELLERNRPKPGDPDLRCWEWRYLWPQCQSDALFPLGRHPSSIFSMSFSPDGKWVAAGGIQGEAKVWDFTARREATTLQSVGQYGCVAFSPTGNWLAATAQKGIVKVRQVSSWHEVMQLEHGGTVRSMSFSPNGKWLALFGLDQRVTVWSLERTNKINSLPIGPSSGGHHGVVLFSPDSQWLAVGETDGRIRLVDPETLTERPSFVGPDEGITALAFSADGKLLASGSGYADPSVSLWNLKTGNAAGRLEGHTSWVKSLAFSPDGKLLASASADQTIRLWDVEKREELVILRGHEHEVWALAFSPDGQTLASGGKDGAICVWNTSPRQKAGRAITLPGVVREASFSADSQILATQNGDGSVTLWDTTTLQQTRRLASLGTKNVGVLFSPNARLLAVGDRSGVIRLMDLDAESEPRRLISEKSRPLYPSRFSPNGKYLLGCTLEALGTYRALAPVKRLTLWAVDSGEERSSWLLPPETYNVALSRDSRFVISGGTDGKLQAWDVAKGQEVTSFAAHRDLVTGIALCPEGRLLATVSSYGDVILWDFETRTLLATLRGHLLGIHSVAFSPDGRRLVTASGGREAVKLWDVGTRQEVATLEGQGSLFQGVQFSPDGNALLAISSDGTLHLWRAPSLTEIERDNAAVAIR